jgi:hypothetical protein
MYPANYKWGFNVALLDVLLKIKFSSIQRKEWPDSSFISAANKIK